MRKEITRPRAGTGAKGGSQAGSPAGSVSACCLRVELRAARFLPSVGGPERMALGLVRILRGLPVVDSGGIYLLDKDRRTFRLIAHWGLSEDFVARVRSFDVDSAWGRALSAGPSVTSRRPRTSDDRHSKTIRRQERMAAFCNVPIRHKGRPMGSLNLAAHQEGPDHFPAAVETTIRSISRQMAAAMARFAVRAETEQQRRNLLAVFRKLPEMLTVVNEEGTILYANPAMGRAIGCGIESLRGRSIEQLHPEECRAEVRRMHREVAAGRLSRFALPLLRRNGRTLPVEISVARGTWDGQAVFFGAMRDLSARLQLEEILRESEENFRTMVQNSRNGVVVLTQADRPPAFVNARAAEMLGSPPGAMLRRPVTRWLYPGVPGVLETTVSDAMAGRLFPNHGDALIRLKSGKRFPVELTFSRTTWQRAPAVLIAIHDVSWRRRLQRQVVDSVTWERQNVARVLHDGIAQQVAGAAYLCKALEHALQVGGRAEAAQAGQVGAGLMECQQQIRSLSRALLPDVRGSLLANLERLAQTVRVLFGIRCTLNHLIRLSALNGSRAGHVYYIVQEAVMNAVCHGKPKNIRVSVTRGPGDRIGLNITDDGSGFVPADVRSEAFGLYLMRYRAERLGGRLQIQANKGKGSRVTCAFPAGSGTEAGPSNPGTPGKQGEQR